MDLITTVTYLEMVSYPKHLVLTKPDKLNAEIKLMVEPTVDFYRYLYDTVGEKWTWIERRLIDDSNLQKLIQSSDVEIYILYVDDNVAGFGEIGWDTASNGSEIKYFGLMPDYIGKRLGPYFLNNIINIAWKRNPVRLRVNTCDLDHPSALRVYQKSGFNILEEIVEKLPDPTTVGLPHPPSHQERQRRLNSE
tara:strand:+ start:3917 stop:4495 length:579 start_codon:yes stop_codon:yes gene_type:complete